MPSSLPQQYVDLLLDPVLVVRCVSVRRLLVNETAQVAQLINEIKQLSDVVGDGGRVGVATFQVFLVDAAHALHALVHRFVVAVGAGLGVNPRLHQENRVSLTNWVRLVDGVGILIRPVCLRVKLTILDDARVENTPKCCLYLLFFYVVPAAIEVISCSFANCISSITCNVGCGFITLKK